MFVVMQLTRRILARISFRQIIAYLVLAMFIMLVYQYASSISDPTQKAIQNDQSGIIIDEAYLIDVSSKQTLDELISGSQKFISQPLSDIPWSFTQQAYWIRLSLQNSNDYNVALVSHFSNPMLEQLTIYQRDEQGARDTLLGWQQPSLSRQERSLPSYSFSLAENAKTELYVRIATEGIAKTPIRIYFKDDFSSLVSFSFLIWGSFIGILIAMSLYNLVLFWGLKDSIYLVYIGYITSVLMMLGVVIGFGHYIWPEAIIRFLRENIIAANTSLMIFSVSFAILFFNAHQHKTRVVKFSIYYLIYLIAFAFISLGLPEYIAAPIFFLSMVVLYPLAFMLIVQQMKKNLSWARLYIISWIPLILGGALQPMGLTGLIESSFLIHHALMIGVLFEVILMAMALADRMQFKKAQALYNVTHEPETDLANINLLESKLQPQLDNKIKLAICIIEIDEFSTLLPYISNNDNNDLMLMLARIIERKIHHNDDFLVLEQRADRPVKIAKINEGTFSLVIKLSTIADNEQERIRQQLSFLSQDIAKGAQVGDLHINLTMNIGISLADVQPDKVQATEVIKQAYQGLEQGKRQGKKMGFYQPEQALNVAKRLVLAADLQQALRENCLQLYHQPQINLSTQQVDGSEALLRWVHKDHGFIPPDIFIQLAEDTGIINELTLWVINTACQQLETLIKQGYKQHNVSVNISGKDISEESFLPNVRKIVEKYDIPLSCLTFELTESVMVNDFIHLSQTMNELSDMGIQVAIDDYGTGYSSLFYISQLPFNEIKIDKSFVMNLEHSERDLTIVKATIEMAKNLGLKIVAEGIENAAIEKILKRHECHMVQGYYYKKPAAFNEYLSWLTERNC